MQTFLPYSDFKKTAECLDMRRLGKQRVENLQIMNVLCGDSDGWANHPAVKMWYGSEHLLMDYQFAICHEWTDRGYKDTCLSKTLAVCSQIQDGFLKPWWLGDDRLHSSHRSNLLRKDYSYYSKFGWDEPDNIEYFWPTKEELNVL